MGGLQKVDVSNVINKDSMLDLVKTAIEKQEFIEISKTDHLEKVPRECGLYLIYRKDRNAKKDWELIYIGVNLKIRQRLREHLFYSPKSSTNHKKYQVNKQKQFSYSAKYIIINPPEIREYIEKHMIRIMGPTHNKRKK